MDYKPNNHHVGKVQTFKWFNKNIAQYVLEISHCYIQSPTFRCSKVIGQWTGKAFRGLFPYCSKSLTTKVVDHRSALHLHCSKKSSFITSNELRNESQRGKLVIVKVHNQEEPSLM